MNYHDNKDELQRMQTGAKPGDRLYMEEPFPGQRPIPAWSAAGQKRLIR